MYTARSILGGVEDIIDPAFRLVDFSDSPAVVLVSKHLRYAWTFLPTIDEDWEAENAIRDFFQENSGRSEEDIATLPQNPDLEDISSRWRAQIGKMWNHVFVDAMRFLEEVCFTVGHFHPPNEKLMAVRYEEARQGLKMKWDTNVLIIPAYLGEGVSIRISNKQSEEIGEVTELCKFDAGTTTEISYLRRDREFTIHVDGGNAEKKVAGILAIGILCTEKHGE